MAEGRLAIVQKMLEAGGQSPARIADFMQVAGGDAALATRLVNAAESGDYRSILKAMSEHQWGRSPAVPVPEAPAPTGSRSPIPFEQRVARDPQIRRTIEAAGVPPALRAGVDAGDPEAIMAAYRGAESAEDSIRTLRKPPDQVAAESIAGQFDAALSPGEREAYQRMADGRSVIRRGDVPEDQYADMVARDLAGQPFIVPARQMELPFTAAQEALPNRPIGPGVAVGIDGPPTDADAYRFADDVLNRPKPGRFATARRAASDFVQGARAKAKDAIGDSDSLRRTAATVAGATAAGTAAYLALKNKRDMRNDAEAAVESGGEADLAAETSPPPAVAATEEVPEPTVVQAPQDYSLQARALINRLNDMRRAAGGEVPEAPAMMREINRLLALGNQTRRATYVAAPQDDAGRLYQQAQGLIDQVNQMYRQGMTPNSPEVRRIMAQVRQLQAQGDAIRNRRAG